MRHPEIGLELPRQLERSLCVFQRQSRITAELAKQCPMAKRLHQALWVCEIPGRLYGLLTLLRRSLRISEIPESMRAEYPARYGGIVPSIGVGEAAVQRRVVERDRLCQVRMRRGKIAAYPKRIVPHDIVSDHEECPVSGAFSDGKDLSSDLRRGAGLGSQLVVFPRPRRRQLRTERFRCPRVSPRRDGCGRICSRRFPLLSSGAAGPEVPARDVLERPAVEGGDRGIELPGHGAHRGRADRPAEDRQQRDRHLAGREAEHEAGEDHAVDVLGAPGIGAHHPERAEGPRARHRQLDDRRARSAASGDSSRCADRPGRARPCARGARSISWPIRPSSSSASAWRAAGAVVLAPFDALGLHGLHHRKRGW